MNRLIDRYPLTIAFAALYTWTSAMVWITELVR